MAWEMKLPIRALQRPGAPHRIVFTARYRHSGRPVAIVFGSDVKTLAHVGPWRVLDVRGTPPDGFVGPVVAPR
jgi:hypothetical protein